jgi:hypothetical protein
MNSSRRTSLRVLWWIAMLALLGVNLGIDHALDIRHPTEVRRHDYLFYALFGLFAAYRLLELVLPAYRRHKKRFERTVRRSS